MNDFAAAERASARRKNGLVLFGLLLTCFVYFFPRWGDWNQNSRFDLVLALVEDRSLTIDRFVGNTGDYAYFNGHYYSDKAPGTTLLGVPVYAAFRLLVPPATVASLETTLAGNPAFSSTLLPGGTGLEASKLYVLAALAGVALVTIAVPSALLGVLFFTTGEQLGWSLPLRWWATLLYTLGTVAFAYSNSFVAHQIVAFLLFGAFAALFAVRRGVLGRGWLIVVGLMLGYAAITEYPSALVAVVLAGYALLTLGSPAGTLVRLAVGAAPAAAALGAYDYAAFGTVLPIGYLHSEVWTDYHSVGLVGLTYPKIDALLGLTFGLERGLFFLSPFLLFGAWGYSALWRESHRRPEFWVLLLAPLSLLLFTASSAMWHGGLAVGPRYLVPVLPFLALAAGAGLGEAWLRLWMRPIVVTAAGWSLFAVWAETIGGQWFPGYTNNPLFQFSLPKLGTGDIARNLGMFAGLPGWWSLAPLIIVLAGFIALALANNRPRVVPSRQSLPSAKSRPGWAPQ